LPRLAAVSNDNAKCKQTINHQSEIALLILAPILILFLVYIKWAIILLYSNQFTCITEMLYWSLIGMYFKTMSWAIGYVFLAKGTSRLFFWSELIANVYVLIINIVFYYFWGLTGLGFAFLASYCLYLLQVFIISKVKYGFSFENELLKILSLQLVLTIACYINIKLSSGFLQYLIGSFIFLISLAHSLFELNRRIALKEVMVKYRQKLFKK
jgi:O-antigen/teichoic acid export membrane protein